MMSLACPHSPSIFGWPSAVWGGANFGSSFGGFRGSIQPGGGAAFGGGGGPCATMRAAVTSMIVPVSTNVIAVPTDRLPIMSSDLLRRRCMECFVEPVAVVLEQLCGLLFVAIENHAHAPRSREHLRVLDSHLIVEVIGIERCKPFDQVQ